MHQVARIQMVGREIKRQSVMTTLVHDDIQMKLPPTDTERMGREIHHHPHFGHCSPRKKKGQGLRRLRIFKHMSANKDEEISPRPKQIKAWDLGRHAFEALGHASSTEHAACAIQ
jgi:hypothetical protein